MKRTPSVLALFLLAGPVVAGVDRVPLEMTGHHAFVDVAVEGTLLSFAFDSGAGGVGINQAAADRLGLAATGSATVTGAAGNTRVPIVGGIELRLGDLQLDGVTAALVELEHLEEVIGRPVDGIIGRNVLEGRLVVLDHDRRVLEIHDRSTFPFERWGEPCPLRSVSPIAVAGEIRLLSGDVLAGTFHIDTGAGSFLNLGSAFASKHHLADRVGDTYSRKGRGLTGTRAGDRVGAVAGVGFCGHELRATVQGADGGSLPILLSSANSGVLSRADTAGLIGNATLLRFNIAFDLDRRRMYLRPNRSWHDPIRADASGLHLIRRPDGTTLVDEIVLPSPAAEARLAVGDELRALNGQDATATTLAAVRDQLREPGRTITLVVARDGKPRSVELHTRALLNSKRFVRDGVLVSQENPALAIAPTRAFTYVGRHPFTIRDVAAGERFVFLDADENTIERLLIVQFESFLPGVDDHFRYDLGDSPTVAGYPFRSNGYAFDLSEARRSNPANESSLTAAFLEDRGYTLPGQWMMWRSLTVTDPNRRSELILFYVEDVRAAALTLADLYDDEGEDTEAWRELQTALELRANRSFSLTGLDADGEPMRAEWARIPSRPLS